MILIVKIKLCNSRDLDKAFYLKLYSKIINMTKVYSFSTTINIYVINAKA